MRVSTNQNTLDKMESFCVGTINFARNGGGNAFMHTYWYNNHHIEVKLESHDIVCDPLTTTRKSMQFIKLQIK